jgi:hypothetical protein
MKRYEVAKAEPPFPFYRPINPEPPFLYCSRKRGTTVPEKRNHRSNKSGTYVPTNPVSITPKVTPESISVKESAIEWMMLVTVEQAPTQTPVPDNFPRTAGQQKYLRPFSRRL